MNLAVSAATEKNEKKKQKTKTLKLFPHLASLTQFPSACLPAGPTRTPRGKSSSPSSPFPPSHSKPADLVDLGPCERCHLHAGALLRSGGGGGGARVGPAPLAARVNSLTWVNHLLSGIRTGPAERAGAAPQRRLSELCGLRQAAFTAASASILFYSILVPDSLTNDMMAGTRSEFMDVMFSLQSFYFCSPFTSNLIRMRFK